MVSTLSPDTTATAITPRLYQRLAVDAVLETHEQGIRRPLIALPTGTGKTIIFALLAQQRGGRTLVLAHRDELISQAVDKLQMVMPDLDIGLVKAEYNDTEAQCVVASVQTLARANRLAQLGSDFATVIADEAHHATADNTYARIFSHVDAPLTLGVTATPFRSDKRGLGSVFDKVVYAKTLIEMMVNGYVCDLRAIQVTLDIDLNRVRSHHGDWDAEDLAALMAQGMAPECLLHAFQEHAADRKALLFTPTVAMAYALAETFAAAGIDAAAIDATTPINTRRYRLEAFRRGHIQVLANCGVLTEGYDEPSIDCIIMARPTRSKVLYVQMLGRGTRVHPGKSDCLILDAVGNSTRNTLHTLAGLLQLDPKRLAQRGALEELAATEEESDDDTTRFATHRTGPTRSQEVALFSRRRMQWTATAHGSWVLSTGAGFIRLDQLNNERWTVRHFPMHAEPEVLAASLPLDYAQGLGEDFIREFGAVALTDKDAPWRRDPATEKQLAALDKMRLPHGPEISKGEASRLIEAKLGGRGRS